RNGLAKTSSCEAVAIAKASSAPSAQSVVLFWVSKKMRNDGGFQPRFPLYRTETHLCDCQKGEPRRCKHRNSKTKRKTFMKDQNIMFTSVLLAIACFALSPTATAGRPRPSPTPSSEDRGNNNSAAENVDALNIATTGPNNTAHGWNSLSANTAGSDNTANGFKTLFNNTIGVFNTATGSQALFSNTDGIQNTATGDLALFSNTSGS